MRTLVQVSRRNAITRQSDVIFSVDTINNRLRVVQDCRELWRRATEVGCSPEGLEGLDAAEAEVNRVRAEVENMHAFLTRARPPLDPVLLEKGRKEISENRYRTADQIRSGCK